MTFEDGTFAAAVAPLSVAAGALLILLIVVIVHYQRKLVSVDHLYEIAALYQDADLFEELQSQWREIHANDRNADLVKQRIQSEKKARKAEKRLRDALANRTRSPSPPMISLPPQRTEPRQQQQRSRPPSPPPRPERPVAQEREQPPSPPPRPERRPLSPVAEQGRAANNSPPPPPYAPPSLLRSQPLPAVPYARPLPPRMAASLPLYQSRREGEPIPSPEELSLRQSQFQMAQLMNQLRQNMRGDQRVPAPEPAGGAVEVQERLPLLANSKVMRPKDVWVPGDNSGGALLREGLEPPSMELDSKHDGGGGIEGHVSPLIGKMGTTGMEGGPRLQRAATEPIRDHDRMPFKRVTAPV